MEKINLNLDNSADIYSKDWCNMIFEQKNKNYGAYILRKESGKRHLIAILISSLFFSVAVSMPTILKKFLPVEKIKLTNTGATIFDSNEKKDKQEKEKITVKVIDDTKDKIRKSIQFVIPKPDAKTNDEDNVITQDKIFKITTEIGTTTNPIGDTTMNIDDLTQPKIIDEDKTVYNLIDIQVQPDFPGGMNNLYKFLKEKIIYPDNEITNKIGGTVYVQFIVGKDGNIRDVSVARPVSIGLDEEAVRVVKAMPAWNPGKQNGMPVAVKFMLPIKFTMMNQ